MNNEQSFEIINKEDLPLYHFVSYEVLDKEEDRLKRKEDLQKAMILGNSDHVKIKIFFMTLEGLKEVETTVWATTDESIALKGGLVVPIHSITRVAYM